MFETIQEYVLSIRRDLHKIPEVGKHLPKTQEYILKELDKLGIPYTCSKVDSSIIADIVGDIAGKTIALRTDMDALPILENNEVDYCSTNDGYMHACGHDAHMAMLLGAAKIIAENRSSLKGRVRLMFQTAEELAKGAQIMIDDGVLEGVDAIYGMHIGSIMDKNIAAGKVIAVEGCCMASYDRFIVKIKGNACHGSTPEKGVDPISIAAHVVISLHEVIARELSATKAGVLTVGSIHAGDQYNIIPDEVKIEGTIRALEENVRQMLATRIGEISKGVAATFRGTAQFEMGWGATHGVNHTEMALLSWTCA